MNSASLTSIILLLTIKYNHVQEIDESFRSNFKIMDQKTAAKMYPYLVSIQLDNMHICDGTIIAPKWILTAAHCILIRMSTEITPRSCSTIRGYFQPHNSSNPEYRVCKTVFINPWYIERYDTVPENPDDVGLIQLYLPYDTNNIIQLATYDEIQQSVLSNTAYCTIMGYGSKNYNDIEEINVTLRTATVRLVHWDECALYFARLAEIKEFCVLEFGEKVDDGSSGGPVICNGRQYGIATKDAGGGRYKGEPSLYTRADFYKKWINATMLAAQNPANRRIQIRYSILFIIIIHKFFSEMFI